MDKTMQEIKVLMIRNNTKYHHIEPYKNNLPYSFLLLEISFH